jgi:chromosome partitioning protein
MHVVGFVSQKGGSGKTTLTGHIAVQACRTGDGPVAVIDMDPQGSLAAWWNERRTDAPLFVQAEMPDLPEQLESLRAAGVQLVFVDTPPAITAAIQRVVALCDHVVVPTRPSPHDLRAVAATVELVERCGKPMVFVVNDATPRARITAEAAVALSQHGTVAPITVHHRTDFAASMIDGRTVMELNAECQSAREIRGLWEYLWARVQHVVPGTVLRLHETSAAIPEVERPDAAIDGAGPEPKALDAPPPAAPAASPPPVPPRQFRPHPFVSVAAGAKGFGRRQVI